MLGFLMLENLAQLLAIALWCSQVKSNDRPAELRDVFTELGRVVWGLPLSLELAPFGAQAQSMIKNANCKKDQAEQAR